MQGAELESIFKTTRRVIGDDGWTRLSGRYKGPAEGLPEWLGGNGADIPYLQSLARLEYAYRTARQSSNTQDDPDNGPYSLNPTLKVLRLDYSGLVPLLRSEPDEDQPVPSREEEIVLIWISPDNGDVNLRGATREDLLALKVVVEGLEPCMVASATSSSLSRVVSILERAVGDGILTRASLVFRPEGFAPDSNANLSRYMLADRFTLQWHVTHACDLSCAHCYDRSRREHMRLDEALRVLDGLSAFCSEKRITGHVTFTGGHPLLYPDFIRLYGSAVSRGFTVAVAGNPDSEDRIKELLEIEPPQFYQVSLEGLSDHNDLIRGRGHYERTMKFLEMLRDLGAYSMVMLTLTDKNIDHVIPLGEELRGRTDLFNFNRLSPVGEGRNLSLPSPERFRRFLDEYIEARKNNPVLGLKENLLNPILHDSRGGCFGGCTGHGCGAAFNFLSLLPDGEVHACRKFPSLLGNIKEETLLDIYGSRTAESYRMGPSECRNCSIRPVCGGCQAVIKGSGLDNNKDMDPYCLTGLIQG